MIRPLQFLFNIFCISLIFFCLTFFVTQAEATSLSVSPQANSYPRNGEFTVNILINAQNDVISSDLILTFNPQILEGLDISPGSFLPSPQVIQKSVNNTTGEMVLSFYTMKANAKSGQGIFATATFLSKNTGTSPLSFDTSRTLVYSSGVGNDTLTYGTGQFTITAGVITSPLTTTPVLTGSEGGNGQTEGTGPGTQTGTSQTLNLVNTQQQPIRNTTVIVTDTQGNTYEAVSNDKGEVTFENLPEDSEIVSISFKDKKGNLSTPKPFKRSTEKNNTFVIDETKTDGFLSKNLRYILIGVFGFVFLGFLIFLFIQYRNMSKRHDN